MNIPEGFVLVPVEAQIEKSFDVVSGKHFPTIKITLPACHPDDSGAWNHRDSIGLMIGSILSSGVAYDEAKERELFIVWASEAYGIEDDEELNLKNPAVKENLNGWLACAQSRAQRGEV